MTDKPKWGWGEFLALLVVLIPLLIGSVVVLSVLGVFVVFCWWGIVQLVNLM